MNSKKEIIKFNMTDVMASSLIEFNKLKHDLNDLKKNNLNENIQKIYIIEKRLEELKVLFITEFKKNNIDEIQKYLNQKDSN